MSISEKTAVDLRDEIESALEELSEMLERLDHPDGSGDAGVAASGCQAALWIVESIRPFTNRAVGEAEEWQKES